MTNLALFVVALSTLVAFVGVRFIGRMSHIYDHMTNVMLPMIEAPRTKQLTTEDERDQLYIHLNTYSLRTLSVLLALVICVFFNGLVLFSGLFSLPIQIIFVLSNAWVLANYKLPTILETFMVHAESTITSRALYDSAAKHLNKPRTEITNSDIVEYLDYQNKEIEKELKESFAELDESLEKLDEFFDENDPPKS